MKRRLSGSVVKAMEESDLLNCSICTDTFSEVDDKMPRTLDCGHSLCHGCLQKIYRRERERQLPCPFCKALTAVPAAGLGSLRANFTTINLLRVVKDSSATDVVVSAESNSQQKTMKTACVREGNDDNGVLCALCGLVKSAFQKASLRCINCSISICTACSDLHLSTFRHHEVITSEKYRLLQAYRCFKHPEDEIKLYCDECDVVICPTGLALNHSGHPISSLADAATKERQKLKKWKTVLERHIESLLLELESASKDLHKYQYDVTSGHHKIDDLTDQLVAAINQRREASHWELEQRAGPIEQFLEHNKCALEASLSRARSSSQGVAPQRECLDVEVFEVSQEAQDTIAALNSRTALSITSTINRDDKGSAAEGGRVIGSSGGSAAGSASSSVIGSGGNLGGAGGAGGACGAAVATSGSIVAGRANRRGGAARNSRGTGAATAASVSVEESTAGGTAAISESEVRVLTTSSAAATSAADTSHAAQVELKDEIGQGNRPRGEPGQSLPFMVDESAFKLVSAQADSLFRVVDAESAAVEDLRSAQAQLQPQGRQQRQPHISIDLTGSAGQQGDSGTSLGSGLHSQVSNDYPRLRVPYGAVVHYPAVPLGPTPSGPPAPLGPTPSGPPAVPLGPTPNGPPPAALLFISDPSHHCVRVMDAYSGALQRTIGTPGVCGAAPGQLHSAGSLALYSPALSRPDLYSPVRHSPGRRQPSSDGLTGGRGQQQQQQTWLYVCDEGNHRVQVFDADSGAHVRFIGPPEVELSPPLRVALYTAPVGALSQCPFQPCDDSAVGDSRVNKASAAQSAPAQRPTSSNAGAVTGVTVVPGVPGVARTTLAMPTPTFLLVTSFSTNCVEVFDSATGAHVQTVRSSALPGGAGHTQPLGLQTPDGPPGGAAQAQPLSLETADGIVTTVGEEAEENIGPAAAGAGGGGGATKGLQGGGGVCGLAARVRLPQVDGSVWLSSSRLS